MGKQSLLRARDNIIWERSTYSETPPFPRNMLVEIASVCNHRCVFCAYRKSTRAKGFIDPKLFSRITEEAYLLGAREIGLYAGAEPLMCPDLEEHIKTCVRTGFTYVYITTNGSACSERRIKRILDAGLHSLKFSINGGDRQTYQAVHGKDQFARVIRNLRFAHQYRKTLNREFYLSVSFVECEENKSSYAALRALVEPIVDEIYHVKAVNQSGQMPELPAPTNPHTVCAYPFNQIHISREGYLRLCCCDYQNYLALADLKDLPLAEAWNSDSFKEIRRRHMFNHIEGTLCYNCLKGTRTKVKPLNPLLAEKTMI